MITCKKLIKKYRGGLVYCRHSLHTHTLTNSFTDFATFYVLLKYMVANNMPNVTEVMNSTELCS